MLETVICYKTKTPVIYNKGTQWETSCDHFLLWYVSNLSLEQGKKLCEELNATHPKTYRHCPIPWEEIDYLFAEQQEPMCG